jgi:ADP-ribose pyrophosphatase
MNLTEKFIRRKKEVSGNVLTFRIDEVRLPNGRIGSREYLDHPGAVAVIPFIDKKNIVLVQQHRYPFHTDTWEIPAGKLARRENPLLCAKRELREETGFKAGRIKKILSYWPTVAFANEVIHIYAVHDLKAGHAAPDEDEFVRTKVWPYNKALEAVRRGIIKDAKTIIALLAWAR